MSYQRDNSISHEGSQAPASLRVLVVEGEEAVRLDLFKLIEPLKAEVRGAVTGREALDTLRSWVPHLVLTEIAVGEVSGLDLLTHIPDITLRPRSW